MDSSLSRALEADVLPPERGLRDSRPWIDSSIPTSIAKTICRAMRSLTPQESSS